MSNRESTVLMFKDLRKTLAVIPNEDAGILMKAIFDHVNGLEPEGLEGSVLAAALYVGIADQIDRLEEFRAARAEAGKAGGSKTKQTEAKLSKPKQTEANTKQSEPPYPYPSPYPSPDINNNKAALPPELDVDNVKMALKDFRDMRTKIKKPMTPRAEQMIINELLKLSEGDPITAERILDQSIMHSWQGIFPLKEEKSRPAYEPKDDRKISYAQITVDEFIRSIKEAL